MEPELVEHRIVADSETERRLEMMREETRADEEKRLMYRRNRQLQRRLEIAQRRIRKMSGG